MQKIKGLKFYYCSTLFYNECANNRHFKHWTWFFTTRLTLSLRRFKESDKMHEWEEESMLYIFWTIERWFGSSYIRLLTTKPEKEDDHQNQSGDVLEYGLNNYQYALVQRSSEKMQMLELTIHQEYYNREVVPDE